MTSSYPRMKRDFSVSALETTYYVVLVKFHIQRQVYEWRIVDLEAYLIQMFPVDHEVNDTTKYYEVALSRIMNYSVDHDHIYSNLYGATATLRWLQIKQYTVSNEEGLQNQREYPKILIKYVAVHPTDVSENYSSSGMLTILIKAQTVSILSNIFAGNAYILY